MIFLHKTFCVFSVGADFLRYISSQSCKRAIRPNKEEIGGKWEDGGRGTSRFFVHCFSVGRMSFSLNFCSFSSREFPPYIFLELRLADVMASLFIEEFLLGFFIIIFFFVSTIKMNRFKKLLPSKWCPLSFLLHVHKFFFVFLKQ